VQSGGVVVASAFVIYLPGGGFFSVEFYPSAGNDLVLLSYEIDVLQQGPGTIVPSHLIASLLGLFFHHEALFLVKDYIIEGQGNLLDGRLAGVDQDSPGVPADDQAFGASFI